MTIDEAIWVKIEGFPNYSISNTGKIRNWCKADIVLKLIGEDENET